MRRCRYVDVDKVSGIAGLWIGRWKDEEGKRDERGE